MRKALLSLAFATCLVAPAIAQESPAPTTPPPDPAAAQATTAPATAPATHVMMKPLEVKWGEAPPALRKGARLAVLSGDPGAAGPFTIRLKFPAGYKIPAHWHPSDEHVTVISGTFSLGMGDKFDMKSLKALPTGSYAVLPAEMRHFAYTRTGAVVQINSVGPLAINYVDPADDPRTAIGAK